MEVVENRRYEERNFLPKVERMFADFGL